MRLPTSEEARGLLARALDQVGIPPGRPPHDLVRPKAEPRPKAPKPPRVPTPRAMVDESDLGSGFAWHELPSKVRENLRAADLRDKVHIERPHPVRRARPYVARAGKRTWHGLVAAGRPIAFVVMALVIAGTLLTFVFPTRTLLSQRHDLGAARTELSSTNAKIAELEARDAKLQTDAEIERLAREQYGMVKPGEKAFVVMPGPGSAAPGATSTLSPAPDPAAAKGHKAWWRRAIDAVIP